MYFQNEVQLDDWVIVRKWPDELENFQTTRKLLRQLETFQTTWKLSRQHKKFPNGLETFQKACKFLRAVWFFCIYLFGRSPFVMRDKRLLLSPLIMSDKRAPCMIQRWKPPMATDRPDTVLVILWLRTILCFAGKHGNRIILREKIKMWGRGKGELRIFWWSSLKMACKHLGLSTDGALTPDMIWLW